MSQVSAFDALFGGSTGEIADVQGGGAMRNGSKCPKGEVPDHRKGRFGRCRHVSRMRTNSRHEKCPEGMRRDMRIGHEGQCRSYGMSRRKYEMRTAKSSQRRRGPKLHTLSSPGMFVKTYVRRREGGSKGGVRVLNMPSEERLKLARKLVGSRSR